MPNMIGEARDCSVIRWSGGPDRSGGRAGGRRGRVAESINRGTLVPDCPTCQAGHTRIGSAASASPPHGPGSMPCYVRCYALNEYIFLSITS